MKVAIAGAGSVGTAIARDLHASGHDVLVLEQDPDLVERRRQELDVDLGGRRRLRGVLARRRRAGHGRRGGGGHRRRRGQPGHLAAGQAGVRRAPGGGPGQPLEEPVAVQRELGRRRLGLHPPAAHRAGRGGGVGRLAGPAAAVPGRHGPPGRGDAGRRLTGRRRWPSPISGIPRDATVVAVVRDDRLVVPRGDTVLQTGDEVLVLVTADAEDAVHAAASSAADQAGRGAAARRLGGRTVPVRIGQAWKAAFFDLDKTVIAKASIAAFGGPFRRGGLINRRMVLRAVASQLIYLQFGADEERLAKIRESMLRPHQGLGPRPGPRDRPRDPARDGRADHLRRGPRAHGAAPDRPAHRVYLVSASPEEIVLPLAELLGVDGAISSRAEVDDDGSLHRARWPSTPTAPPRPRPSASWPTASASTWPRPPPTRTRPPTCPCSRPSATRWRSTPTAPLARVARERGWEVRQFTKPVRLRDRVTRAHAGGHHRPGPGRGGGAPVARSPPAGGRRRYRRAARIPGAGQLGRLTGGRPGRRPQAVVRRPAAAWRRPRRG